MQTEIENAANFWLRFIQDSVVPPEKKDQLRQSLIEVLVEKYTGHWHLDQTNVGSGYRSISNWRSLDRVFVKAAKKSNVEVEILERHLPRDLVLWCDPYNVTYRVGDHGTVFTIYEDKRGLLESVKKSMAEKASKSNGDFVISAYTTPVVIRSADGVEISRRGGSAGAGGMQSPLQQHLQQQGSPTKGTTDFRRTNAMSPLRQVTSYRDQGLGGASVASPLASSVGIAKPIATANGSGSRWSPSTS
ncbi:hypothetical protein J3B02_003936 [Coemansia erecta]|uniref:Anti-proliferative protein domain-containing protein n=1 Tax=Coemansia asiatica TaxID=1052880 RepID=A0A9W7XJH0_9FUNG|nr:hypothetical protein LPJ64_002530 [Coemansia asiatica]KAJ2848508.1 hypothetical protein J3B02_003936 [Coemansia erecta]KAJ2859011.1 hypothetical protein FB639_005845 [Coemansia asiatica]